VTGVDRLRPLQDFGPWKCGSFTHTHYDRHRQDERRLVKSSTPSVTSSALWFAVLATTREFGKGCTSASGQLAAISVSRAFVSEGDAASRTRDCHERRRAALDGKILRVQPGTERAMSAHPSGAVQRTGMGGVSWLEPAARPVVSDLHARPARISITGRSITRLRRLG
jgi:hypothetical protein